MFVTTECGKGKKGNPELAHSSSVSEPFSRLGGQRTSGFFGDQDFLLVGMLWEVIQIFIEPSVKEVSLLNLCLAEILLLSKSANRSDITLAVGLKMWFSTLGITIEKGTRDLGDTL